MKKLIVSADDFGLHELINEGIIEGHVSGCITSASIMAGGDSFEHAIEMARQHPDLGVGVHLTLVGARPVARGDIHSLLTRDGSFYQSYGQFATRFFSGRISKEHIEYELRCQMQKVVGKGITITHIDSHQHLHALPGMAGIITNIAKEFNVYKIRIPAEPLSFLGKGPFNASRFLARTLLTGCANAARYTYKRHGLRYPNHFFGMLAGGQMSTDSLLYIVERLPDGVSEIMVHPGKSTEALKQVFRWNYSWQEEMEAIKSREVMRAIETLNIQLVNFGGADSDDKGSNSFARGLLWTL